MWGWVSDGSVAAAVESWLQDQSHNMVKECSGMSVVVGMRPPGHAGPQAAGQGEVSSGDWAQRYRKKSSSGLTRLQK